MACIVQGDSLASESPRLSVFQVRKGNRGRRGFPISSSIDLYSIKLCLMLTTSISTFLSFTFRHLGGVRIAYSASFVLAVMRRSGSEKPGGLSRMGALI